MTTRAYILIETSVGKSQDVVNTLEEIDEETYKNKSLGTRCWFN